MRGDDRQQEGLFSYVSPEQRVPRNHPLRRLRPMVDGVLGALSSRFSQMYARVGRLPLLPRSCWARSCCKASTASAVNGC